MRENGLITRHLVRVNSGMLMVIILKGNGRMIKRMVRVCTFTLMVPDMKDLG